MSKQIRIATHDGIQYYTATVADAVLNQKTGNTVGEDIGYANMHRSGVTASAEIMDAENSKLEINFSNSVKFDKGIAFSANIGERSDGWKLRVGQGGTTTSQGVTKYKYCTSWVEINETQLMVYTTENDVPSGDITAKLTRDHGLAITDNIQVHIHRAWRHTTIELVSKGESFVVKTTAYEGCNAKPYASVEDCSLTDVTLGWYCNTLHADTWIFGDSYSSLSKSRWPWYMMQSGFTNVLVDGYPGAKSSNVMADFEELIKLAVPRRVCWFIGGNDTGSSGPTNYKNQVTKLLDYSNKYDFEVILWTFPFASATEKNVYIRSLKDAGSIKDYVDICSVVWSAEGTWRDYMLGEDDIHPTEKGAIAMAKKIISVVPELMGKGISGLEYMLDSELAQIKGRINVIESSGN